MTRVKKYKKEDKERRWWRRRRTKRSRRETVLRQRQALDPEAGSGMLKEETRVDTARGEGEGGVGN